MPSKVTSLAVFGCGAALLTALLPAVPALAVPVGTAPTTTGTTVAGQVNAVVASRQQLTVHTAGGRIETIKVTAGSVLVHGVPATVRSIHTGMTVLAQGRATGAATFTATAVRAFTPAATTSTMRGIVGTVDQTGRTVVVLTAPYETAVAYLMPGMTVSGPKGTSGMNLLQPGAPVTFTGHTDSKDASELLASAATVTAPVVSATR